RTARSLDRLSAVTRADLRARLEKWIESEIDRHLRPLTKLAGAASDAAAPPGVRALAAMLGDAGGMLPRKAMLSAIAHLEQKDRQALHKLRVRLGPLDVFVPALLKPTAQFWRAALLSVRQGDPMPRLPAAGAATLEAAADPRAAELAYRRLGRTWLRIDLADRLASHARKVRSAGGEDPLDSAFATSIGLDDEAIGRLMNEIGFAKSGDAWRWRGRRGVRPDRRAAPSHAFAELAKLKKRT